MEIETKKQYDKEYYLKNKERIINRCMEYTRNNKDKRNGYEKKHRKDNEDHYKEYRRSWCKLNKERINKSRREWESKNPEKREIYSKKSKIKCKEKWIEFVQKYKDFKCEQCGYNKCKSAIEFHHEDPKSKLFDITKVFHQGWGFTENNILKIQEELEKVIVLCANCHRELHEELKMEE